jgi:hypothetical protein
VSLNRRYADLLNPEAVDTRSAEEIIAGIRGKLQEPSDEGQ